ncbi:bacillithiol biosynthesis cysteine-adding enzyme BshC [Halobacillus shinanisalinarum]|uniref:Putative cysteine ligase BshC n=1 Tax=Halobacillus shinanisalinarum TaxID=2932258 RepID=A0ABY4GYI2_9BACI|nr:bacillithiol biosynthesis cysteine-adding enzyme BshC [Halobacillus shinanisalinarum]UOQ93076.1 bacillithiol biosynthesis cysteine-adding enzyme BshC [Halobacillus shinanisalinarum]
MRIDPVNLKQKNVLVDDYLNDFTKVENKFEYNPYDEATIRQRAAYLNKQSYNRDELVATLTEMNDHWGAPEQTFTMIDKLKDETTSAVVAGQQAGLLTGPLYTVHKIISVIQLAKQQEKQLGTAVVPVFWIAGEDHDFAEINHVMMKSQKKMKKIQLPSNVEQKLSVSDLPFDREVVASWLKKVFAEVKETEITRDFYQTVVKIMDLSESYSDFFARVIYQLFNEEGLIIVDAHHKDIRSLESNHFQRMIEENTSISEGVYAALQKNQLQGYPVPLDSELDDAHLFYHHHEERILLTRDEEGSYKGKRNEVQLTEAELLQIAKERPWQLSNNVVTRPLMQEFIFPVLAFIGGPGEISYWSVLKPAFQAVGLEMPPIYPRLSFTLVDRKAEAALSSLQLELKQVLEHGTASERMKWLAATSNPPIERLSDQIQQEMNEIHKPLREKAAELGPDIGALAEKNIGYLNQMIEFLEQRMLQSVEEKYEREMEAFTELDVLLHPGGGLQERVWNIVPWVNAYGMDVFQQLNKHRLSFNHPHYVVYL